MKYLLSIIARFLTTAVFILAAYSFVLAQRPTATPTTPKPAETGSTTQTDEKPKEGWSYDPDAGFVYRKNDFKASIAGYAEGLIDPGEGGNGFRRARQSVALEFPRFTKKYRAAFFYEVDFTNNNFFRAKLPERRLFENLFVAVEDAEDAGKFRILFGHNTHILSREDNLSSGNLPTINRSLILEEHGSVNSFGPQFGFQVQKAFSPRYSFAFSVTGWLGDQKRRESERAERINNELQTAYAELRETVGQLLQAERLSSLAEIASGVVHEVRNPLGAIKGAVEILEDELSFDSPRREFALIAKQEVERIDKLVQEFFHFARAKEPNRQPTDINELIHSVKLLIENQATNQNVEVCEDLAENIPPVSVDPEQIKQVLLNLAINALQAMPEGGKLIFRSGRKNNNLYIEIEDTGGGIDEAAKAKIFDPFFSTKDKGLGLGLSVVYKIIKQHGGLIQIFDTAEGTRFKLTFVADIN